MMDRGTDADPATRFLAELIQGSSNAANIPPELLPALLLRLAAITTTISARLSEAMLRPRAGADSGAPLLIEDAARYAGCSEYTLSENARAGKIPSASKPGKRWRFTREGLDRWIASRRGR